MVCDQAVTEQTGKLMAFTAELKLWKREMEENKTASFSTLNLEDENVEFPDVRNVIMGHLEGLALDFECYFPKDVIKHSWVLSPFNSDVKDLTDDISTTAGFQQQH
jgi:hypothetical protein